MSDTSPRLGTYHTALRAAPGWHWLFARGWGQTRMAFEPPVRVGVGELFVVAGQSNAAGSASMLRIPATPWVRTARVRSDGSLVWGPGADPQTDGSTGSPWPLLGDRLGTALKMPIGFINVAEGGTSIREWLPGERLYRRLVRAIAAAGLGRARAVLWQQGEHDLSMPEAEYHAGLVKLIQSSQAETHVPWLVATSSWGHLPGDEGLRRAQLAVCREGLALPGPDFQDLGADYREWDLIHLNEPGTRIAAERWGRAIERSFFRKPALEPPHR